MRLDGKTIIITGASSGIGAAAAELFAAEGANLVLGARREVEQANLAGKIGETGRKAKWLAGDIAEAGYHKALVDLATSAFGGLDGAFNNAGTTGNMGPIPDMTTETWERVIATNLTGGFHAARHQIPAMKARGGGSIVFTSSFVGHTIGLPGMGAYAASKAGLIGLVQVLAAEHGAEGIRANALLPGGTKTAMAGDDASFHDWVKGLHALKRMAEPEEIARAALFLVCDDSSFVTGSALMADGGNSINKT
ncbi:MAG: short-chain dehydrogenase [Hoeflea sp. BRH_c9]|nr:MAG: short-chain dehydrogenase [Hoeflea sp. BRH_c9]